MFAFGGMQGWFKDISLEELKLGSHLKMEKQGEINSCVKHNQKPKPKNKVREREWRDERKDILRGQMVNWFYCGCRAVCDTRNEFAFNFYLTFHNHLSLLSPLPSPSYPPPPLPPQQITSAHTTFSFLWSFIKAKKREVWDTRTFFL